MKHLKKFNEAIIDWKTDDIDKLKIELDELYENRWEVPIDTLKKIANKYDIDIIDYYTFYEELPTDEMRNDAPPSNIPFFGLYDKNQEKIKLVSSLREVSYNDIFMVKNILKHENIHKQQNIRSKSDNDLEYFGNVKDKKAYFSNKHEIMAFSQTMVDIIITHYPKEKDIKELFDKVQTLPHYKDMVSFVDEKIIRRYNKYIYLYLELELNR